MTATRFRRYRALIGWLFAVIVTREILNQHQFNPRDRDDLRLLFGIGVIIGISVVIMLAETRCWTLRKSGIFGLVLFDALFYGLFLSSAPLFDLHFSQHTQNWFRALLIVSGPLLLLSQIRHGISELRAWRARRALKRRTA